MNKVFEIVQKIDRLFNVVAGCALVFIVVLTTADVVMRATVVSIVGTYEIVGYAGALVIVFALPLTTWKRSHIFVDFFILGFPPRVRNLFHVFTRLLVLILFFLIGVSIFRFAQDLQASGEVSPTLRFPFYPVVFASGVACFVQCLVILTDFVKIFRGEYE